MSQPVLSQFPEIKSFEWIEFDIDSDPPVFNYTREFISKNQDSKINYRALDIQKCDPSNDQFSQS
jgi:hypothetical protein